MFGQLLRDSEFKGNATYDKVISLAKTGLENDEKGYKREFIRLAELPKVSEIVEVFHGIHTPKSRFPQFEL
jgi:hypothetical protein